MTAVALPRSFPADAFCDFRIVARRYGSLLGPEFTIAIADKYFVVGTLTLDQLRRGISPEELDLFEIDPDAEEIG